MTQQISIELTKIKNYFSPIPVYLFIRLIYMYIQYIHSYLEIIVFNLNQKQDVNGFFFSLLSKSTKKKKQTIKINFNFFFLLCYVRLR